MSGVRDHLEAIREKHGYLTPNLVVEEATPKAHPLHGRFEWDNRLAGAAWRREQAHQLIRSVRVAYLTDERPKNVRAYLAVPRPDSLRPSYEPTETVMADEFTRRIVLTQMEREWRTLQARYGDLVEFADLVRASVAEPAA